MSAAMAETEVINLSQIVLPWEGLDLDPCWADDQDQYPGC